MEIPKKGPFPLTSVKPGGRQNAPLGEAVFAQSKGRIRWVDCAIYRTQTSSVTEVYLAGQLFKRYFKEKGYTVETLTDMNQEERQEHGITLLRMAKDERRNLFDFLEE